VVVLVLLVVKRVPIIAFIRECDFLKFMTVGVLVLVIGKVPVVVVGEVVLVVVLVGDGVLVVVMSTCIKPIRF
jgi:hypothetical protein